MKVKEKTEKIGLKLNIQKTKIMASSTISSWQIGRKAMEAVIDFIFERCSKITADADCSHEIKRHLLLGRKLMTSLDSIFKTRDVTLPTKVRLVLDSILKSRDITLSTKLCLVSSVQFSRSVVSDSLRPHESQHARPPCPSPTPGVHSESRPSSQ